MDFLILLPKLGQGNNYQCFQLDGTVQLFRTKGQKFLHCPVTKGQQDKLKIWPWDGMGWDGLGKPVNIQDGKWDRTITIFLSRFGTECGTGQAKTFFFYDFPVQNILSCFGMFFSCFGTFFSCFFVILSRDITGQRCLSRPQSYYVYHCPSLGNASNYPHATQFPTALYYVALKLIIVNRDTLKCHTELGLQCFLIRNSATYKKLLQKFFKYLLA